MTRVGLAVLAALVVAACGGDDGGPDPPAGAGDAGLALSVDVESGRLVAGRPVTWVLTARNGGEEAVVLEFRDAQRGEVVLEDDGGVAYRWSDGQAFAQMLGDETVPPGDSVSFRLAERSLDVEPGTYHLTATLATTSVDVAARATVEVHAG